MLRKEHVSRNVVEWKGKNSSLVMLRKEHVSRNAHVPDTLITDLRYAPQGACV